MRKMNSLDYNDLLGMHLANATSALARGATLTELVSGSQGHKRCV